ncbi:hypothetical protein C8F01DRAFT_271164 [Mycena amicta]|nr:hypothetical protein C8F01DRAFT_271164 [Mycena amicta]
MPRSSRRVQANSAKLHYSLCCRPPLDDELSACLPLYVHCKPGRPVCSWSLGRIFECREWLSTAYSMQAALESIIPPRISCLAPAAARAKPSPSEHVPIFPRFRNDPILHCIAYRTGAAEQSVTYPLLERKPRRRRRSFSVALRAFQAPVVDKRTRKKRICRWQTVYANLCTILALNGCIYSIQNNVRKSCPVFLPAGLRMRASSNADGPLRSIAISSTLSITGVSSSRFFGQPTALDRTAAGQHLSACLPPDVRRFPPGCYSA